MSHIRASFFPPQLEMRSVEFPRYWLRLVNIFTTAVGQ